MTRPGKDLRNVDLADVHARLRQPRYDSSPLSDAVFTAVFAATVILFVLAALHLADWLSGGRWSL